MSKRKSKKGEPTLEEPLREDLRLKLRNKLKEKKLERTPRVVREHMMDKIEEKLEKCRSPTEQGKLKEELKLLEKIEEKEINNAGEFAEYSDNTAYGGAMEHPN